MKSYGFDNLIKLLNSLYRITCTSQLCPNQQHTVSSHLHKSWIFILRFGHSLVPKQFSRISPRRIRQGKSSALTGKMNMAEIFFKVRKQLKRYEDNFLKVLNTSYLGTSSVLIRYQLVLVNKYKKVFLSLKYYFFPVFWPRS